MVCLDCSGQVMYFSWQSFRRWLQGLRLEELLEVITSLDFHGRRQPRSPVADFWCRARLRLIFSSLILPTSAFSSVHIVGNLILNFLRLPPHFLPPRKPFSEMQKYLPVVPHKAVAEVSKIGHYIGEVSCCESRKAERIH